VNRWRWDQPLFLWLSGVVVGLWFARIDLVLRHVEQPLELRIVSVLVNIVFFVGMIVYVTRRL